MKWWLLALLGCDSGTPSIYGTHPHMLFRSSQIALHDTAADVARKFPQLGGDDGVRQFVDGPTEYRVWFDEAHRVSGAFVYVTGRRSDLEHAWGGGTQGTHSTMPATFFFDADSSTGFIAFDDNAQRFVVQATPYLPLAKIFDEHNDLRVFGIDMLHQPMAAVIKALRDLGLEISTLRQTTSKVANVTTAGLVLTDEGFCALTFDSDLDDMITRVVVQIGPHELPDRMKRLHDLFVAKWGSPTLDRERGWRFPNHKVIEYFDKSIIISDD
jgi:hypothetical protein